MSQSKICNMVCNWMSGTKTRHNENDTNVKFIYGNGRCSNETYLLIILITTLALLGTWVRLIL